ncbi:MAG TPA: metalloregulator ArsR/SmtB family transcription factor [Pirellulaceae bacterium]|nr:metalloregulator ArsR/SmtB family transcription factor [Pirellulaceae bacterium]HMO92808.1 metalloregulator ArsR/SmtB family transcription factor [Pirellulaceae bacterium]HMP69449.1 metalloregulator ArsR/SmtB family transcription factor [Pirellulaceae bacterium]
METKQAVKALAALAQESRLDVFRLLVEAGTDGMSAGEISERLIIPPATMSFHLKELSATGLIEPTRSGRSLIYSLRPDVMNELLRFLIQDCCQGRPELCQPGFTYIKACCESPRGKSSKRSRRKNTK